MLKKAFFVVSALAVCMTACGCKNDNSDKIGVVTPFDNEEDDISFVTKADVIAFPGFLEDEEAISRFSHIVYSSFDAVTANTPFEEIITVDGGYKCDVEFSGGKFYRFLYNNNFGIVDNKGNVKLQGVYSSIRQIRPDLFELVTKGEKTYATVDENNDFVFVNDQSFDWVFEKNKLEIVQAAIEAGDNVAEVSEGVKYYLRTPDGRNVYDKSFDSIAEGSKENLEIDCESVFVAYSGGSYYLIAFDEYYNYKVYEGSYGNVSVQIDEQKGDCYILSYDHFMQLISLFNCFDFTESNSVLPTDNFVSVEFNSVKNNQTKYYICDNGYCEITSVAEDGVSLVKTVYMVSPECFADALDWIDSVLSTEYAGD